jgi:hypothetical protein
MTSKFYEHGEFSVTVLRMKDADNLENGERKVFAVIHDPTGVQVALTSMPTVAIKVTAQLSKYLEDVRKDPMSDDLGGVPPSGFGGFPGGFGQ